MTRPTTPVEPADILRPVRDWLRTEMAAAFPELTIDLELPPTWRFGKSDPVLAIADDGGPLDQWPVNTRPQLRVTSYTTGVDTKYVRRALGLLLCKPVPGLAVCLPGSSLIATRDSRSGADMASATVRTRVRTTAL